MSQDPAPRGGRASRSALLGQVGLLAVGLGLGLTLGWLVVRGVAWGQVADQVQGVSVPLLAAALVLNLLGLYLRALRWRILLTGVGVSTARLFLVQQAGAGLNNLSPVRVFSEPIQFGLLVLRDRLPGGGVALTLGVGRSMDLLVHGLVIGVGLVLYPPLRPFVPYILPAVAISVLGVLLWVVLGTGAARLRFMQRLPVSAAFADARRTMATHPHRVAGAMAITLVSWALTGLSGWATLEALGGGLDVLVVIVVVQASLFFALSLPGLPTAAGTFHFAAVILLSLWDVKGEVAISYALIQHVIVFLPPTVVAAFVLPREGLASLRALRRHLLRVREARTGSDGATNGEGAAT